MLTIYRVGVCGYQLLPCGSMSVTNYLCEIVFLWITRRVWQIMLDINRPLCWSYMTCKNVKHDKFNNSLLVAVLYNNNICEFSTV